MTKPLKKNATYADLCAVPENFVAEILEGELYAFPRPAIPHAHVAAVLGGELMGPFHRGRNGPGGWLILDEPELHFGADVLVPDIAGWRRERLPIRPDAAYLTLALDWLCEVLSKSSSLESEMSCWSSKTPTLIRDIPQSVTVVGGDTLERRYAESPRRQNDISVGSTPSGRSTMTRIRPNATTARPIIA